MTGEKKYVELGAVIQLIKTEGADGDYNLGAKKDNEWFCAEVNRIPAADVVEARHGANIGEDYDAVDQFVCSKCGVELQGWYRVERDMDDGEETHHEYVMRFCPNCGAKMDGGAE